MNAKVLGENVWVEVSNPNPWWLSITFSFNVFSTSQSCLQPWGVLRVSTQILTRSNPALQFFFRIACQLIATTYCDGINILNIYLKDSDYVCNNVKVSPSDSNSCFHLSTFSKQIASLDALERGVSKRDFKNCWHILCCFPPLPGSKVPQKTYPTFCCLLHM